MVDLSRIESLVGKDIIKSLKKKHILICGVGGVGSFVAEALARSGIGELTLIDFDVIDSTNLNRQLMTNKNNIGSIKVDELAKHLKEISDVKIHTKNIFIDETFKLDKKYDYVVDCIDSLSSKFHLVKICHLNKVPVISSLGSARRIKIENIKYTTLDKTRNDPLAKAFRTLVKKENYKHKIDVVYVDSPAIKTEDKTLGSSIFVVGSVGLYIASIVFNKLIDKEKK